MIGDPDPLVNKFISTPRELSHLNCASFMAGIVRGALEAAEFVRVRHEGAGQVGG